MSEPAISGEAFSGGMRYLVVLKDGRFAGDAKARKLVSEYPNAHLFDSATDAYHTAKMLSIKHPGTVAVSERSYASDTEVGS
jgi:hypothetical protein